jgi:hypothetical protein
MGQVDPATGTGEIQIPPHITGLVREMFARIVAELSRRNAVAAADTFLIEKLAEQLARIQGLDPLVQFGYAIASAAEAIKAQCWNLACEIAGDLQLPPDELERLVWT